jgi:hypothetical protein
MRTVNEHRDSSDRQNFLMMIDMFFSASTAKVFIVAFICLLFALTCFL